MSDEHDHEQDDDLPEDAARHGHQRPEGLPSFTFTPEILAALADLPQAPNDHFDYGDE